MKISDKEEHPFVKQKDELVAPFNRIKHLLFFSFVIFLFFETINMKDKSQLAY
jgi:hypothetical protein